MKRPSDIVDSAIRVHVGWVWYQRQVRVPRGFNAD